MAKKDQWAKTDSIRCSEPRGGAGKAAPHTLCVLLQQVALILVNNFITEGRRWGYWLSSSRGYVALSSLTYSLCELVGREGSNYHPELRM